VRQRINGAVVAGKISRLGFSLSEAVAMDDYRRWGRRWTDGGWWGSEAAWAHPRPRARGERGRRWMGLEGLSCRRGAATTIMHERRTKKTGSRTHPNTRRITLLDDPFRK
jgi:hypothetical protein